MFESQNLFKTIQCPYYSQTSNTCERVYCPFKHSTSTPISNTQSAELKEKPNGTINIENNKKDELPSALENLSNALQTFQDLIKQNQMNLLNSSPDSSKIVNQLNNLSSAILSTVPTLPSSSTQSQSEKPVLKKSNSTQKKLNPSIPDYNPTPIEELKKLKQEEDFVEKEEPVAHLKRKEDSLINNSEPQTDNNNKKLKTDQESKPKCDLVTFSKLSLNQQVLKRYEMLNMKPPTLAEINQAKLKKKLEQVNKTNSALNNSKKPTDSNIPQLIMENANNSSIPLAVRQRNLMVIFENCKILYKPIQTACQKAAENEKSIYDRAKNKQIYINLCANLIKSLRNEQTQLQQQKEIPTTSTKTTSNLPQTKPQATIPTIQTQQTYSHEALLNGSKASRVSYSINRNKPLEFKDLSVTQLYQMFYTYILSEKQLDDNSFPKWIDSYKRIAHIPNFTIANKNSTEKTLKDVTDLKLLTKTCKRCNKNFYLNADDNTYYSENSECVYHWGKLRSVRVNKSIEQKYPCCSGSANSTGCEEGKHVYDGDYDGDGLGTNLTDYVETRPASTPLDLLNSKSSKNIYALDCEMCYTTKGLEVARVSIVDIHCKTVYESLIKPEAQILDYNTRWSGLTESSLKNCTKKLKQVQLELLQLFNTDTILIGHSLDSDFKALKLIHKNVIDTSVVFPHKMGPPLKRALRNLMSEYLQRIIQEDSDGHDSKEDANACVQLMTWKINEDLKSNKPPSFLISAQLTTTQSCYKVNNMPTNNSPMKLAQPGTDLLLNQVKAKIVSNQQQQQQFKQQQQKNLSLINNNNNNLTKPIGSTFKIQNKNI